MRAGSITITVVINPLSMTCSQVNSEQHLDVILETEEVIRLNQQISCLRAEIEKGDRQIKELEEQVTEQVVPIITQVGP